MKFCDFLRIKDFGKKELLKILKKAFELKYKTDVSKFKPFANKSLAMIFEKSSTRTRVSFEVGFFELGGHPIFLNSNDIQLGRGESIEDTAKTLSEYVDMVVIRTFGHDRVEKLAKYATIPVINGLSDMFHPAQVLSDIFSIMEAKGCDYKKTEKFDFNKINLLYIGDGMNVAHSLIDAASIFGMNITLACPKGYEPNKDVLKNAQKEAKKSGSEIKLLNLSDLKIAATKADVIYTDVWTSMGKEKERAERLKVFKNYQINKELLKKAKKDVLVMHCLPAHRGEEITDEVMDSNKSIVFTQAGNRLHVQKAIMVYCMDGYEI